MAISSTPTLLPLDRFARIAGIHPCHFNQVSVANVAPVTTCDDPLLQYSWQDADRTGREEIAQMIAEVEAKINDFLNYSVRPVYYKNTISIVPKVGAPGTNFNPIFGLGTNFPNNALSQAVPLGAGFLIGGGQEQKVALGLAAPITYTDADGDGYFETATVVVTNVDDNSNIVTAWQDVSIYYPGHVADDEWEIRPVTVTVDPTAGTITCVFRREQAVLENLLFGYLSNAVDGTLDVNFLGEVDVYHHWLDTTQTQSQLSVSSTGETATAIILPKNAQLGWGLLQAAHYDNTLGSYVYDCFSLCGSPDDITTYFKAGWPLDLKGNMDGVWERCITYLVLSMLDRPLCACASLATFTAYWSYDFAENNQAVTHQLSQRKLDNPLGTTRAALYAWEQILRYRNPDVT